MYKKRLVRTGYVSWLAVALWMASTAGVSRAQPQEPPPEVAPTDPMAVVDSACRVYGVSKTIADLFKARNRVGLEIAVEALREAWRDRRFTMADLDRAARACRVERVMRPYVEGVVA